jgi:hypothetical protein
MPSKLKARLQALEVNQMDDGLVGGVVTYGRHETPEQAVERALKAGRRGGVLVVPEVMSEEDWVEMAAEHHRKTQRCKAGLAEDTPPS